MAITLSETDRQRLQDIAADTSSGEEARRNARIILRYAEGAETRDVAAEAGLSESRARFWRKVFERHGMGMFAPDFTPERRAPGNGTAAAGGTATRSEPLLSSEEAARLRGLLDGDIGEELRKRVQLILSYSSGKSTNEIAREIGLSASRTRFWRKAFERERMRIFASDGGPASHPAVAEHDAAEHDAAEHDAAADTPADTGGADPAGARPQKKAGTPAAMRRSPAGRRKTPDLRSGDSLSGAARKVLRLYFREMLHWGDSPHLGEDPEVVHKMRVATRRMRSAFDVFEGAFVPKQVKPYRKGLKRLGRVLGRVRDLDVLIMHMQKYMESLPPENAAAFRPLIAEWEQQRGHDLEALRVFLQSDGYTSFCAAYESFLASEGEAAAPEPTVIEGVSKKIGQIAPLMVLERYTDILAFDAGLDSATLDQLHMLRIQFKKMRYTMEFFVDLLGPQARKVISEVTDVQDYLGNLQDDQTAMELITAFTHDLDIRQTDRPLAERLNTAPLLTYLAERQERKHELLTSFGDEWSRVTGADFRRRLLQTLLPG